MKPWRAMNFPFMYILSEKSHDQSLAEYRLVYLTGFMN